MLFCTRLIGSFALVTCLLADSASAGLDHDYPDYAAVLSAHVVDGRVDYERLKANRARLDRVVDALGAVRDAEEQQWTRDERLAFWINAYNIFTLRVIVDHYPIKGSWLSWHPSSSIRQIDGVWTEITWRAAGRTLTLDDIEHTIIRPEFREPRIHFAINCAAVSCPPLKSEPYRAATLDQQLDDAARAFLTSPLGLEVDGRTLRVTSIFKWFGKDFVAKFASERGPSEARSPEERAILAFVREYGPREAAAVASREDASIAYLSYDWSLNDTASS